MKIVNESSNGKYKEITISFNNLFVPDDLKTLSFLPYLIGNVPGVTIRNLAGHFLYVKERKISDFFEFDGDNHAVMLDILMGEPRILDALFLSYNLNAWTMVFLLQGEAFSIFNFETEKTTHVPEITFKFSGNGKNKLINLAKIVEDSSYLYRNNSKDILQNSVKDSSQLITEKPSLKQSNVLPGEENLKIVTKMPNSNVSFECSPRKQVTYANQPCLQETIIFSGYNGEYEISSLLAVLFSDKKMNGGLVAFLIETFDSYSMENVVDKISVDNKTILEEALSSPKLFYTVVNHSFSPDAICKLWKIHFGFNGENNESRFMSMSGQIGSGKVVFTFPVKDKPPMMGLYAKLMHAVNDY